MRQFVVTRPDDTSVVVEAQGYVAHMGHDLVFHDEDGQETIRYREGEWIEVATLEA